MKLRKYLVRTVVGATAFLFSLGIFTTWQHARLAPEKSARIEPLKTAEPPPQTAAEPQMPETANAAETAKFDAEGYYYISGDPTPKGFEDFQNFNITNKDYKTENEADYGKLIAPEGYVQAEKELKFNKISIGDNLIRFETERVKGISYSFEGEFIETRSFVFLESEETEKVLKGVLIKKRGNRKIAEAQALFGWFAELGCGC